jgi:hypothetical protein
LDPFTGACSPVGAEAEADAVAEEVTHACPSSDDALGEAADPATDTAPAASCVAEVKIWIWRWWGRSYFRRQYPPGPF